MAGIVPSRRVRGTPFTAGVQAAGVKAYTVYNLVTFEIAGQ